MPADALRKIFLVEDEAIIALSEKRELEKYGYSVETASSGEEAVERVADGLDIDLILMDIDLGAGIDGTQAAERILENRELPIVFLSSHTEPEIVEKTERITSYGYVVKNSSITVFDASIKMAFKLFDANKRTLEDERKQNTMISNISDVIVIIDPDGINRYKSPNVRKLFGWAPEELVGKKALDTIHPDDLEATRAFQERLIREAGSSGTWECRYRRKDGSYAWIEITMVNLIQDPAIRGVLGNYHDISARKKIERENQFERLFNEKLLDSLPGIFYLYTYPELRLVRWNRNHETFFGYESSEMANRSIMDWHLPENREGVREAVDLVMEKGANTLESSVRSKNGEYVPYLMTGTRFEAENRKYLMGIGIDITEQKKIEKALKESEEYLSITLQSIGDAVIATDIDGRITRMNKAAERLTGWESGEAKGLPILTVFNIVNAETRSRTDDPVAKVLESGEMVGLANHSLLISRNGEEHQIADSAAPIHNAEGEIFGVVLAFSDRTEKYRIEAELRESQDRLSSLFGAMTEMVALHELIFDADGNAVNYRILDCNPAFTEITGIRKEDAVGRTATEVYGTPSAPYLEEYSRVATTGVSRVFSTYYAPMRKHFAVSAVSFRLNYFATITTDITKAKNAELAIRTKVEEYEALNENLRAANLEIKGINESLAARSAELQAQKDTFSLFMDYLPAIVFMKDDEGRTVYTNKMMDLTLGAETWIGRTASEIFDGETAERIRLDDERTMRSGYLLVQERFPDASGAMHDYETQKFVIPRTGKRPLLGGIAIDYTARKQMEEALREKSEELDHYFSSSLDLLCISDFDGNFVRLNPEWESVLGFSLQELVGRPYMDFVHPDDREKTSAAMSSLVDRRELINFENRYRCADGSYKWIEWRARSLGKGIYSAARDVTGRKRTEDELKKQIAEKETLLKEVHHRIKNNLSSIEALLSLQTRSDMEPEALSALHDAIGRIRSSRILYENLLVTEDYSKTSVKNYVESIIDSVVEIFAENPRVRIRRRIADFSLASKKLFSLGIIVTELLTNVFKYAFSDSAGGTATVDLEKNGSSVCLTVEDDGRGLPEGFNLAESRGFGLELVRMLAEQLGGSFSMESDSGTKSTLVFRI